MTETKAMKPSKCKNKLRCLGVLLLLAVLGVGGWFAWHNYKQPRQERSLQKTVGILNAQLKMQQSQLERLTQVVDAQQVQVYQLKQSSGQNEDPWILSEVEYLLRLVDFKSTFEGDQKTVVRLLAMIVQRLQAVSDPHVLALRQQVQHVLTSVQARPAVDLELLGGQFKILSQLAMRLTLPDVRLVDKPTAGEAVKEVPLERTLDAANALSVNLGDDELPVDTPHEVRSESSSAWSQRARHWVDSSWHALQKVVVVHPVQDGETLLFPEQVPLARQHVHNLLDQVRWAAFRHHPALYAESLEALITYVDRVFDGQSEAAQQFSAGLVALKAVQWPDNTVELETLRAALAQVQPSAARQQEFAHD